MKKIFLVYYIVFNLIVISLFSVYLTVTYSQKKALYVKQLSLTTLLISEWIKGTFNASDYILRDIIDEVPVSALKYPSTDLIEHARISQFIDRKRKSLPYANGVGLNDEKCIMTHTPALVGFDASQREWCAIPMHDSSMQTYVSNMFISNINDMMVIQVRKFPDNKGLAGIGVNLNFFSQWLKNIDMGENGVIAILDTNFNLLAREPSLPESLGKKIDSVVLKNFTDLNCSSQSYSGISSLDDTKKLYSIRKVEELPFIVVVGKADMEWLNGWHKQLMIAIGMSFLILAMSWVILSHYVGILKHKKELENISIRDQLTNLYNRYKLHEVLESEFHRAERVKYRFGVIMLDIDNFKTINDKYGHNVGDSVLKELAILLQESIRVSDSLGRWGGEEFLIIMPQGDSSSAELLAEKLRNRVEKQLFTTVKHITASFGVAVYKEGDTIDSLVKRADDGLYKAKNNGRNQVGA